MEEKQENSNESTSFLQEIYKVRWQTYRSELKRCQTEPTEEAVHDLRVATRRLLALIDLLRDIVPNPRLKKLQLTLKKQFDGLSDLRDTQVMLVETSESLDELPELEPFQKYLNKSERRLLRLTAKAVKSFKYSGIRKQMDAVRKKVLKQKLDTISSDLLLHAADNKFGAVLRRYQRIDQANPATIHRTRIAFKKFRYMVEIIYSQVPGFPEDNLNFMHEYQGVMGDIQDMEVFLATFEDFAERDASYDPEPVLRYFGQRHKESINTFIEDMHQVNIFWRSTPEDTFPWETSKQQDESSSKGETTHSTVGQENDKRGKQVQAESEARQ
jgi:CHAD domain-containing protein